MNTVPRCEVIPEAGHQVSFRIARREVLRWHAAHDYPRPYFFPVIGPSGESLTRMGHPGAPNHDHHQSVWFAHNKTVGIDFWSNQSNATIRQMQWLAYEDGDDAGRMAVELGWFDGHNPAPLLKQQLICEVCPCPTASSGEFTLELQSTFIPESATLEFQKTNFGFLAIRVAKVISGYFGGGILTNSQGAIGEQAIFAQPAQWIDYSGNVGQLADAIEGITYLDHPGNPGQPTCWHVREDGWMCASPTMKADLMTSRESPLRLRYQLLIHAGAVNPARTQEAMDSFAESRSFEIRKAMRPHVEWQITRE